MKASCRKKANAYRAAQVHDRLDTEMPESIGGKKFAIPGFHHCKLMHILKSSIEGNSDQAKQYHWLLEIRELSHTDSVTYIIHLLGI